MQTEITLAQVAVPSGTLEIGCRKCDRYGRLRVDKLIAEHGAGMGLSGLPSLLAADCPRGKEHSIYDRCGAYYPQLPRLFG
jgi:hypothetical protein